MKNVPQYLTIVFVLFAASVTASAQTDSDSSMSLQTEAERFAVGQNNQTDKKSVAAFQIGANFRVGAPVIDHTGKSVVVSAGCRFNRKNYLGLAVGVSDVEVSNNSYGPLSDDFIGIPLFLDYIRYCPIGKAKKHSIIVGAEVGALCSTKEVLDDGGDNLAGGSIVMIKAGMDFKIHKRFHMNWGVHFGIMAIEFSYGIRF